MLIALCASHVDGPDRQAALHRMIRSVASQTTKIKMYLSISGTSDNDEMLSQYDWLIVKQRGVERLTQFQHYALLCQEILRDGIKYWCLFTDDDDIWHETRVAKYMAAIDALDSNGYDVVSCVSGRIHNGRIVEYPVEYFEFATKFHVFAQFFRNARPELLKLRGCDLIFRNVMRSHYQCTMFRVKDDDVPWLYNQHTPKARMNELSLYLPEAEMGWRTYVADTFDCFRLLALQ